MVDQQPSQESLPTEASDNEVEYTLLPYGIITFDPASVNEGGHVEGPNNPPNPGGSLVDACYSRNEIGITYVVPPNNQISFPSRKTLTKASLGGGTVKRSR
jgi:hypothetical protein